MKRAASVKKDHTSSSSSQFDTLRTFASRTHTNGAPKKCGKSQDLLFCVSALPVHAASKSPRIQQTHVAHHQILSSLLGRRRTRKTVKKSELGFGRKMFDAPRDSDSNKSASCYKKPFI
jgi:hypothetical protein